MIGSSISHYKVTRLLGRGGMGEVYEAVDESLDRHVAIKILLPRFAEDPEVTVRFFNEARSVNLISHPGLVQVYEFGQLPSGGAFLVMEYINGSTLRDRLKESERLPEMEALQIALQLSSALAAAHAKNIIHRDLKPGNVMLIQDPTLPGRQRVKLLDFGIAKLGAQAAGEESPRTRTGLAIGTPTYMSPEQCRSAKAINGKADVYSLGVLLYQMLAGRLPFEAESEGEMLGMQMYEEPQSLLKIAPHVTRSVAALVHRMLRKRADDRPSAHEVEEVLTDMAAAVLPTTARQSSKLLIAVSSSTVTPVQRSLLTSSTLGAGAGQRLQTRSMRLRHWLLGLTERSAWLSAHTSPRQRLLGIFFGALLILLGAGAGSVVLVLRTAAPGPSAPPVPRVRWTLNSTPVGAQIVRQSDQSVLGQTPWTLDQPASEGTMTVVLRLARYKDHQLVLDQGRDVQVNVPMELVAEPAKPEQQTEAADRKGGRVSGKAAGKGTGSERRGKNGTRTKIID